jgi:hypothetical protein
MVTRGHEREAAAGTHQADQRARRIGVFVRLLLLGWLVLAMLLQMPLGLADNGDFSRIMTWFTSGPVGFAKNWPPGGTEEWHRRFFRDYLPDWKLDFPGTSKVRSSVLLLWWPGVWLNQLLFTGVLKLWVMSLPARGLLFLSVLGLLRWLERRSGSLRERLLLYGVVAVPLVLMLSTTDYLALLNSFYQETGSLVFLLLFLLALLNLRRFRTSPWAYGAALAALGLLAAAKPSNFYWALIGVPAIAALVPLPRRQRLVLVAASLACAAPLGYGAYHLTKEANDPQIIAFHGLFYGVLTLSDQPQAHLQALGLPYDAACLGVPSFDANGQRCRALYADAQLRRKTVLVLAREPVIIPRLLGFVAGQMQTTRLEYLGNHAAADRAQRPPAPILRLWSVAKERYFPRGYALLLTLIACIALNVWNLRGSPIRADLAFIGLLTSIACATEMLVAFLGDGRQEIVKHLLLANMLFDVAMLASLAATLLVVCGVVSVRRGFSSQ